MKIGQEILASTKDFPQRLFKLKDLRGQGAQGMVFFATALQYGNYSNKDFALKFCINTQVKQEEREFLKNLINYQNSEKETNLRSNMIKVFDFFEYKEYLVQVMEKGDEDLYDYLNKNRQKITLNQKYQMCFDIVLPIYFLHYFGLIHRDIKPENYMKIGNTFKLIDFGLVRRWGIGATMTKGVGTPLFQAPELIDAQQTYTYSVDVWALGCVFYEIFSDLSLFQGQSTDEVKSQIINTLTNFNYVAKKINELQCDPWLKTLLVKMLQPDKNKRINTKDLIAELSQGATPDQKTIIFPNLNQNQQQIQSPQQQPQQQQPQNQFIPPQQQFVQIQQQPIQQQQPPPQEKFPTPSKKQQKVIQQQQQIQQQPAFQQQPIQQQSTIQQPTFQQQLQQQQQLNNQQQQAQQISIQAEQIKQLIQSISNLQPKILEIEKIYNNQDTRLKQLQEETYNQISQLNKKNQEGFKSVEENLNKQEEKLTLSFQQQLQNLETNLNDNFSKLIQSKIELYDKEIKTQFKQDNIQLESRFASLLEQQNKQFANKEEFDKQFDQLQGELHLTNSQISSIKLANDQQIMKQEQLFNLQIQQHINTLKQLYEDFYQQCSVKINDLNKQMETLLDNVAQSNNQDISTPFVQVTNPLQNSVCQARKSTQKQDQGIQEDIFRQSDVSNNLQELNQSQLEQNNYQELQTKFEELSRQLEIANSKNIELNQNLLKTNQEKEKVEKQLTEITEKQNKTTKQLNAEKKEKTEITITLSSVTKNYQQIQNELEQTKQKLDDCQKQLVKANLDNQQFKEELVSINQSMNQELYVSKSKQLIKENTENGAEATLLLSQVTKNFQQIQIDLAQAKQQLGDTQKQLAEANLENKLLKEEKVEIGQNLLKTIQEKEETEKQLTQTNQNLNKKSKRLKEQLKQKEIQFNDYQNQMNSQKTYLENKNMQFQSELIEIKQLPNLLKLLKAELENKTIEQRQQIFNQNQSTFEKLYEMQNNF